MCLNFTLLSCIMFKVSPLSQYTNIIGTLLIVTLLDKNTFELLVERMEEIPRGGSQARSPQNWPGRIFYPTVFSACVFHICECYIDFCLCNVHLSDHKYNWVFLIIFRSKSYFSSMIWALEVVSFFPTEHISITHWSTSLRYF